MRRNDMAMTLERTNRGQCIWFPPRFRSPSTTLENRRHDSAHDAIAPWRVEEERSRRDLADLCGHPAADHRAGAVEPGLDGLFPQTETFTCLTRAQTFDVAHHENRPV